MAGSRFEFDGRRQQSGGQQFVSGRGRMGDGYTNVHRLETHGFASEPVKGGQGIILHPNGDPDEAFVLGGESPGLRPSLPAGAVALYDQSGNIIKLIGSSAVFDFGSRTATMTAQGGWTIIGPVTIEGNVTIQGNLTASGSIIDGDGDGGA